MVRRFLAFMAGVGLFAQAQAANLLSNGNFEGDTTGWVFWNSKVPFTSSFHSAEAKHSGLYGAKIKVDSASPTNNWWLQLKVPVDNITLKPNQTYQLTYWVKSTNTTELYGAFEVKLDTTVYVNLKPQADWTQGSITVKTGAAVTKQLSILLSLAGDTGTYYFDDFVFDTVATGPVSPLVNLLAENNPGLETVDTAEWVLNQPDATTAGSVTFDSTAHTGSKGLHATITAIGSANWGIRVYVPAFDATKDNKYTISFWGKSDSTRPLTISFQTPTGDYQNATDMLTLTTAWKQYSFKTTDTATSEKMQFALYLGAQTGNYYFDDFVITEEEGIHTIPVTLIDTMILPTQGAWYTGKYRNLFVERGHPAEEVDTKVKAAFNQLFFGAPGVSLYRVDAVDTSIAYIDAVDSKDIRTEGMSYGMMIALQMDRQDVFNKLWKFAKTKMQMTSGAGRGYFAWRVQDTGAYLPFSDALGPAPDGEEYFVTSLFLADKRWGSAPGLDNYLNYKVQADSILTYMLPGRSGQGPMIDTARKQIRFIPNVEYTDPSYHLPAFYRMWAAFSSHDTALWRQMADTSMQLLRRASHPVTGLSPKFTNFDGVAMPAKTNNDDDAGIYATDAVRTPMNIGLDWSWFMADSWEKTQTKKQLGFFLSDGISSYLQKYSLDGIAASAYTANQSQVGANGAAVLASDTARDWAFVDALYATPIASDEWRYYNGTVQMLGLLMASGNFKAYGSPGLTTSIKPRSAAAPKLVAARLVGQILTLSGVTGTVRLLDAQGREAARKIAAGSASFTLPHAGLWVVDAGAAGRRTVVLP